MENTITVMRFAVVPFNGGWGIQDLRSGAIVGTSSVLPTAQEAAAIANVSQDRADKARKAA